MSQQLKMTKSLYFQTEKDLNIKTRDVGGADGVTSTEAQNSLSTEQGESTTITTSPYVSVTSSLETSPTASPNNTFTNVTQSYVTTSAHEKAGHGEAATAIGVIAILAVITLLIVLIVCCLKRRGKLNKLPCCRPMTRTRRSSSSSRHVLEEHEVMDNDARPKPEGQSDDMFTIDDLENVAEPQEGREEYYYDEVFGQSQFEDEATNTAMRELYSNREGLTEEEILDLDFETLGIRITDYGPDIERKNTI